MQAVLINVLLALTMVGVSVLISFHYLLPYSSIYVLWTLWHPVEKRESGKKRLVTSHIWQTTFELEFLQKCCLSTSQLCTKIVKLWFSRFFHRKINPQQIVRYINNSWENLPIKDTDHRVAFKAESCQKL